MNSKIPAEIALKKYLVSSGQPDDPRQLHRAEMLDCVSLSQLDKYLERRASLTDEQLDHLARCAGFCQQNLGYLRDAYQREHGVSPIQELAGKTRELLMQRWESLKGKLNNFGKAVADTARLIPVFPEEAFAAQVKTPAYPVLIEDAQRRVFKGNCRVTRGKIKEGRFIARFTFEVPPELPRRPPIQVLFVGKDGEVFQALDLPGLENQLINIRLPAELPDRELSNTDPLPCALVLRLGQA